MLYIANTSLEYIRVPVQATENGVVEDISTTTVTMAFLQEGSDPPTAASAAWKTAGWETDTTTTPDTYYARALVGPSPGVQQLSAGTWDVYVKITDSPEVVIRKASEGIRVS